MTFSPPYDESITGEQIGQLPVGAFSGEIIVVDRLDEVTQACVYLHTCPVIGFDTETRPSFTKGVNNRVALLQLSSNEKAFLFRLNRIGLPEVLCELLTARNIIKVGAAIHDDLRMLRQHKRFTPQNFVELQNLAPYYGITDKSLRKLAALTLHLRISKAQRLSNWEAQQLTPAQQLYAATDAWVGLTIFQEFARHGLPLQNKSAQTKPGTFVPID